MIDLTDKVAIVTGSTKGIGLAIAESLVEAGASVVVSARTVLEVEAVAARLGQGAKGRVLGIPADVGQYMECERLVAEAVAELGRLDILVNNAGLGIFKSIEEMRYEEWRLQMDVNVGGIWACTKAALPHLKLAEDGWVINIGSLAGRNTFASGTGYNASKFAVVGMTEAMMLDLRQYGIRCSVVMPGSVNTCFSGTPESERGWKLEASDCALAVMQLLQYPRGAHVSRIEMRPAIPDSSKSRR
jgi:NAD(P)-dependent dehydrogenase (short-subunit alcohol dehydrogenase family)